MNLIKEKKGNQLNLKFSGDMIDPSLINAYRRTLMGEMMTYSLVKNLKIIQNDSMFNDQYLETRIKLTPIYVNKLGADFLNQNLVFKLCADGLPDEPIVNQSDVDMLIKSHMFQIFDEFGNQIDKYKINEILPYNFILLKLRKGQKIHVTAEIESGIGRNHASFKGCQVTFKFENDVSMGKKKVTKVNPITKEKHESIADKQGYPKNRWGNPQQIGMTIRPNGHYDPELCFTLATDTIITKLDSLQLLLDNEGTGDEDVTQVEIIPSPDIENYIQIKITDPEGTNDPLATHTLGNLLANHMFYRLSDLVEGDINKIRESMTAYRQPHPLLKVIYLHIKTPDGFYAKRGNKSDPLRLLDETIMRLREYLREIKEQFGA